MLSSSRRIVFAGAFLLPLLFSVELLSPQRVFAQTGIGFSLEGKSIPLKEFKQLISEYLGETEIEGEVSFEVTLGREEDSTVFQGHVSSPKMVLTGGKLPFPLELSQVEGDFSGYLAKVSPLGKEEGEKIPHLEGEIKMGGIKLGKLLFSEAKFDYLLEGKELKVEKGTLHIADGQIELQSTMDFASPGVTFFLPLTAKEVNLEKAASQIGVDKPISGILNSQVALKGQIKKPESYAGKMSVQIGQGELTGLPLLANIISLLHLRLSLNKIILQELTADFALEEGFASTDNLKVSGPGVVMEGEGKVGWDKSINFIFSSYFSNELLGKLPFYKVPEMFMSKFGNALLQVRLMGTLDKSQAILVPLPVATRWLERLRQIFPFPEARE